MVSKELIEENKKRLLEEKERLEKLLGRIAKPKRDGKGEYEAKYPDFGTDADENATEVAEYETNIAEEHQLEERHILVNKALARIEDGTYGIDVNTGKEIPEERLKAAPEAETGIDHEEK